MMLFLGILGILQATVVPGLLLQCTVFRLHSLPLAAGVAFGLSLVTNYILVWLLVIASLYTQKVILGIFLCEIICLVVLLYKHGPQTLADRPEINLQSGEASVHHLGVLGGRFFVVLLLVYTLVLMISKVGDIFTDWDAVCSWNRWAVSWASGLLPIRTNHYPQLVPIVLSVPYIFIENTSLQFFSYAICLFFLPLSVGLCMALQHRREFVFPACVLGAGILLWFLGKNTGPLGYADFPVLFFGLLSMVSLLEWSRAGADPRNRLLVLSLVFAAGAALTKQAGGYWLLLIPFAIWENAQVRWSRREVCRLCGIFLLLIALVAAWYIYIEILISRWRETSEISTLMMGIHKGRSFYERWVRTLELWPAVWGLWAVALSGVAVRRMRVFALMGLSYTICWSLFFSYSLRNLSIGIPFLCWSAGVGIALCYERGKLRFRGRSNSIPKNCAQGPEDLAAKTCLQARHYLRELAESFRHKKKQLLVTGLGLFLGLFALCGIYSSQINKYLTEIHNKKTMAYGNHQLNILLSKAMHERKLPLISTYPPAYSHPDIGYDGMIYAYGTKVKDFLANPKFKKPYYLLFDDSARVQELEELSRELPLRKIGAVGKAHLYLAE